MKELTAQSQDLQRDLQGIATDLKWSAVELLRLAKRLSESGYDSDAQSILRLCKVFNEGELRLEAYAEEVRSTQITRGSGCRVTGSDAGSVICSP